MFLREPFEEKNIGKILSFIESQNFATLVSADGINAPVASHLPVDALVDENSTYGRKLITHLANGNPHLPLLFEGGEVLVIFLSNSNYISPSWFANKGSAPTQSHIVVHAYGKAKFISDPDELLQLMTHQVNSREQNIGANWQIDDLEKNGIDSRLSKISGIEISINRIEASFRLLQDESKNNIKGVLENGSLDADTVAKIRDENEIRP